MGTRALGLAVAALQAAACAAPVDEPTASAADELAVTATSTLREGAMVVRTSLPATAAACGEGARCRDADGDGLADAWEAALLDRVRPRLVLHADEPLLADPAGRFGCVARVFPAAGAPGLVRVVIVTGSSFDPGVLVLGRRVSAHDGDSERVALELELREGGREAVVRRGYFAGHEGTINDESRVETSLTYGSDPDGQPRWLVFASKGKHASFARPETCNASSFLSTGLLREACAASEADGHPLLPPAQNAGELGRPLGHDLAGVGFPGDDAWLDQPFCGGLRASPRFGACAPSVVSKLVHDPFAAHVRR